jgi:hypothetical protein
MAINASTTRLPSHPTGHTDIAGTFWLTDRYRILRNSTLSKKRNFMEPDYRSACRNASRRILSVNHNPANPP